MDDPVRSSIISRIEKHSRLPKDCEVDEFDYLKAGYVDSIAIVSFVVDIEAQFDIEILESDMESSEFRTIGGLVAMVKKKMGSRKKSGD